MEGQTINCLDITNSYRAKHQAGALEYDQEVEQYAIGRARTLAKNDRMAHLPQGQNPYGENLFYSWTSDTEYHPDDICQQAVESWNSEVKLYDFANPGFSGGTGHFTQLVWKSTTKLGCASSQASESGNWYVVCNYEKPGNMLGDFENNVLPAY